MAPRRSARTQQAAAVAPPKEEKRSSAPRDLTFLASPAPAKRTKGIAKKAPAALPRRSIGSTPVKVPGRVARPKSKRKPAAGKDVAEEKPATENGESMEVVAEANQPEHSESSEPSEETNTTKKRGRVAKPKQATKAAPEKKQRPATAKKMPLETLDIRSPVAEAPEPPEKADHPIDFTDLKVTQVINESPQFKTLTLLGIYHSQPIIVVLEKSVFDEAAARRALIDPATKAMTDFNNDIYSHYKISPSNIAPPLNSLNATVIWPANETVLAKYTRSEVIFFSETPDVYSKVVEPFIDDKLAEEEDYNNWIYNILDGKSETDRVILNDPELNSGFMLVQNLKSSGDDQDVNVLAICQRRDIKSLRDLNDTHLILLKNILTKGTKAIKDKYKKSKGQLRSFIHYQPSFYHFHVHFKMVDAGAYQASDRDNLLSTVINNITLNKDYYKKSTLTYPLAQSTPLYKALKIAKRV